MITDLNIAKSDWMSVNKMLDCVFHAERVIWVPGGQGGQDQVVFVLEPEDGRLRYVYTFAVVAVRAFGILKALCPCDVVFHQIKGYYTLDVFPVPEAYV
jgi:hypothetical protein